MIRRFLDEGRRAKARISCISCATSLPGAVGAVGAASNAFHDSMPAMLLQQLDPMECSSVKVLV